MEVLHRWWIVHDVDSWLQVYIIPSTLYWKFMMLLEMFHVHVVVQYRIMKLYVHAAHWFLIHHVVDCSLDLLGYTIVIGLVIELITSPSPVNFLVLSMNIYGG